MAIAQQPHAAFFSLNKRGKLACKLADGAAKPHALDSLDALLVHTSDEPLIIGGIDYAEFEQIPGCDELLYSRRLWFARDLAYVFQLPDPGSLAELQHFAAQVLDRLCDAPSDVLAQAAVLAAETGAGARLSCLTYELEHRHDLLNQPPPGEVDIAAFQPAREERSAPPRQELPPDLLSRIFEAQQKFEEVFENYEERPQQIEMARAVEEALAESRPLVVEAGTGVGKSLAYLVPLAIHAARHGKLCLVSTNTLNLQQQLIDLDLPRLTQILDELHLRITLAKGREHYLCVKRLEDLWLKNTPQAIQRRAAFSEKSIHGLLFVLRLLLNGPGKHGDMGEIQSAPGLRPGLRGSIERNIDCAYATCLGERCEYRNDCHFFSMRARAMQSHIVVANHALVFSLHNPDEDSDSIVSKASAIVFDEAHNLESAITNQLTLEVDDTMPVELGNRLLGLLQDDVCRRRVELSPDSIEGSSSDLLEQLKEALPSLPSWIKLAAQIRGQVNDLLMQAESRGHFGREQQVQLSPATASPAQLTVMSYLSKLAARLLAVIDRYREIFQLLAPLFGNDESAMYIDSDPWQMELKHLGIDLQNATLALSGWVPDDTQKICWFNAGLESAEPGWSFRTAPLDTGPAFQSLFNTKESCILCSATLSVAGSFDYLQSRLGFTPEQAGRTSWLMLDSPFDYSKQSMLLVADDLAGPTGPERDRYLEQVEDVVAGVAEAFPRGVLVLFNSYRDMQHIADALIASQFGERLLVQGMSGSRAEIANQFRAAGDRILLATRSFWEGFDVSGEALSCVVLAKLPFANFRDPIHAGRQRAIDAGQGDSFRQYSLPMAAMQLKQGFGRLIRTKSDFGCVFLLDSRIAKASYGNVFIDSLPGPAVFTGGYSACLAEAQAYMRSNGR